MNFKYRVLFRKNEKNRFFFQENEIKQYLDHLFDIFMINQEL